MPRHSVRQAALGLAFFLGFACSAGAGSFAVNPVRVTLSASQPVSALTVRNTGTEPTVVQLETASWSQHEGEDRLAPTSEILATPPIFTIPPGGSQIVRVGLRRAPDAQREMTYRLVLNEVPPPKTISRGLRVALRVSMPVFVAPATATTPDLTWHALRAQDGTIRIVASNRGAVHVQIGQLSLSTAADAERIAGRQIAEYVLPGNSRTWTVTPRLLPAVGAVLGIAAQTDAGPMQAQVTLEADTTASIAGVVPVGAPERLQPWSAPSLPSALSQPPAVAARPTR